jgi:CO/xanthine dehydrogenase Mo-binding subunit
MTNAMRNNILGAPADRVDGPLKVAGAARYPSDVTLPGLVHAALVRATITAGTITRIDTARAEAAPGVLTVITHENAPALAEGPMTQLGPSPQFPLKDNRVLYHRQPVAIVVAQRREQATSAARLVELSYQESQAILGIDNPLAPVVADQGGIDTVRGDAAAALASAEVVYDQEFTIAADSNNPLGLFATVAHWEGDRLTVHESTQWPTQARTTLATFFSVPQENVRVLVPYLGGGFGAGLRTWPHTLATVLAARMVNRPVKLVLTRPEMFTAIGHRPQTVQRLRLATTRDGRLLAIDHESTSTLATEEAHIEPIIMKTLTMYACENLATRDRQVRLSIPSPGAMRAPGTVEGNFAIESALDELSYQLGVDPIETYRDILTRHGMDELVVDGVYDPRPAESALAPAGAFAAVFAEIRIDQDLGVLRVARLTSVIDGGRILNEKTARSQIIGAAVNAIGMTMLEETVFDPGTGRIANATFGDYLVPVNADVPDIDVVFVGEPDRFSPIGAKGLGEVGIVGVSAAIANAVYHATGRRIRSLPITVDKLL